jgi:hypothetical protein
MPKLHELLSVRQDGPRFEIGHPLPELLVGDNWVLVNGVPLDLLFVLRWYGWEGFDAVLEALGQAEAELDNHQLEIEDDAGFYMAADGGANWIVKAIDRQQQYLRHSRAIWGRWNAYREVGELTLKPLAPRPPRGPRRPRLDRLPQVETLAEPMLHYGATAEDRSRHEERWVNQVWPQQPVSPVETIESWSAEIEFLNLACFSGRRAGFPLVRA